MIMARHLVGAAFLATLCSLACTTSNPPSGQVAGPDESQEPPQSFVLAIDGDSVRLIEGEPARLDGTFTNPELTLTAEPHRIFPYGGVRFSYPRTFTFEADLDNDYREWTLSGNNLKIMYFKFAANQTTADFADGLMEQFGRRNCRITDAQARISFGDHTLSGTSLHATVAGHSLMIDVYQVPSEAGWTRLLVLQDNPNEAGERSSEGEAAIKLIQETFSIQQ